MTVERKLAEIFMQKLIKIKIKILRKFNQLANYNYTKNRRNKFLQCLSSLNSYHWLLNITMCDKVCQLDHK